MSDVYRETLWSEEEDPALIESLKTVVNGDGYAPAEFIHRMGLFDIKIDWLVKKFEVSGPYSGARGWPIDIELVAVRRTRPINLGVVVIADEPQIEGKNGT
ncbi:hypothetical protein [Hyphomicrobium sp. MC8b]|uniref:hypothetical protein n=1 Tax=Hyphomicrobium sp. MC8b TaxID=300273 RepID=UPI00391BD41B